MELSRLYTMIKYLEYGTNLHIAVVFLGNVRNTKCELPHDHVIHSKPVCQEFKKDPVKYDKCLMSRNLTIRKAVRSKCPFGALCVNGVYEYTRPVLIGDRVVAVIFVGNILTEEGREKLTRSSEGINVPFETMEMGFDRDKCEHIGELLEGYIITLLEKYPEENNIGNPIIEKIKSYVQANIQYDLSLTDIAGLYFYSEVYLGRLFKKETGSSFKEYVNSERIKLAAKYLTEGKNVIEAANMAGYNSVSYFNRVFKAQTGKTPSEYKSAKANS